MTHPSRQRSCLSAVLACFIISGCGLSEMSKQYGGVSYPEKNSSINGLGIFMKLCDQAGSRCFVTNRLSPRLDKAEAIILVGDAFEPPAKEARDWLESWLGDQPGRSVVYFGRDFEGDIYYREQTLDRVPAPKRPRAAIALGGDQAQLDALLMRQISDDVFSRWFTLKIHKPRSDVRKFKGAWAESLNPDGATWPVRVVLDPPQKRQAKTKPKWLSPPSSPTKLNPLQPRVQDETEDELEVFRSVWSDFDINDDETWIEEWDKAPDANVLLAGEDGTALITKLTSERYSGSHILTIVNGAPLLNGSIVEPHFRAIAHKIIEDIQPAKRIALLPFDEQGILISHIQDENEVAGLSVLTTWPMNFVVAHLAFLGVLICLALFPILGRPQGLRTVSLSDFGQHAEAVGRMLQRTGDTRFAQRIITDYYRIVRGEVPPGWLKSAVQPPAPLELPTSAPSSQSDSSV